MEAVVTTVKAPIKVKRLQHIVLQVSDVERSVQFYHEVLGLEFNRARPNGNAFLRLPGTDADHHLALFPREGISAPKDDSARLIHSAWEVDSIEDLAHARDVLVARGALIEETNHGMSLSVYGRDPDGIEFEVFFSPGTPVGENVPLDLQAELEKRGVKWPAG
jgi:catechol-2,3-dioxygenase